MCIARTRCQSLVRPVCVSVGSVLATGVGPGVRVPVLEATGAMRPLCHLLEWVWVFNFQLLGREHCVFPATGVREEREGLSAGSWSAWDHIQDHVQDHIQAGITVWVPGASCCSISSNQVCVRGRGFVSKHQGCPDSEEGTLSLGWGVRWAEGLCWYIQGDWKMWSARGMSVWARVFASEHQAGVADK